MIKPGEVIEPLTENGLKILQKSDGFRFGADSVLLSRFAKIRPGTDVLDLGTGSGVILLLCCDSCPDARYFGLEINAETADMAARSVAMNGLENSIRIIQGDIRLLPDALHNADAPEQFRYVVSNPPYFPVKGASLPADEAAAAAKFETTCTLRDVVRAATAMLCNKGYFALVHKADRAAEVMNELISARLIPKRAALAGSDPYRPPALILIEAQKNGSPGLKWESFIKM